MTGTATAGDLMSGNQDNTAPAAAPAPASPAPSWTPAGMPTAPAAFDAPEAQAARDQIQAKLGDKEFFAKIKAQDPAAHAEWSRLHKIGYPAPQAVATPEDVAQQQAARNEQMWNGYFSNLAQRFPLSEEQKAELRAGIIREDLHRYAREEKDRLIKDRAFRTALLDGSRAENLQWGLITSMLSLRPVKQ
jgi:hypothetical protein